MSIKKLRISNFGAFESATVPFSPGLNVIIGANSTGKTQLMKTLYTVVKTCEEYHRNKTQYSDQYDSFQDRLYKKFMGVFKPDTLGRLIRRGPGRNSSSLSLLFGDDELQDSAIDIEITTQNHLSIDGKPPTTTSSLYLPSREVLTIAEGFVAAYQQRETQYDETYLDLMVALSARPIRGPKEQEIAALLRPLEKATGAKTVVENGRFYVKLNQEGKYANKLESHLVSEGYLKLAQIAHLIRNGALAQKGILFWDEPEANLNPQLITTVAQFLLRLVRSNIQIFLATHDYLLTQELAREAAISPELPVSFLSFYRPQKSTPVEIEVSNDLDAIANNPILEEFAAYYDREVEYFQKG